MIGIESSLYTAAIALCLFSAGILRDKQSRTGRPFAWFSTFLVLETLGFTFELLMVHPATPLKGLWLALRIALSLLVGPCLWLAVKESVEGMPPRLAALGRGHLWPIVAGIALLVPLVEDAHFGLTYVNEARPIGLLHARFIHATMLLCIGIFAVQVPYYLWQCRRLLVGAAGSSKWLQLPLLIVLTTWALGLLRTIQCATHGPQELVLLFALTDVGVTVAAIYMLVRRAPMLEPAGPPGAAEPIPAPETKYARSSLDAALRERIRRKLEAALMAEEIQGDSLLNLRSLSRAINEKAHYVSQVINQDLATNFYELVNRHRIDRARKLLADAPERTVLEIALAVGFNSKSTFNTAFRRNTGMTPSEFRAESGRNGLAGARRAEPGLRAG